VSTDVVIAGAWFAARNYHLAMMPGLAPKLRLGRDWGVGLLFGRASADLGQLGHPDPLERHLERLADSGGDPAVAER
jgi:hypothetical protein